MGAYIAQAAAAPTLEGLRADVAGLFGVAVDGVAFVESATAALRALLAAWPLAPGGEVAVAPSEWGPNLAAFDAAGLRPVLLATDDYGVIDLDQLRGRLAAARPALVHVTQVAAHRGLVQPVARIAAVCRDAGIPLWVDAAQALGHVATDVDADAAYATGRKWLCGPRGVGMLAIDERAWPGLRVRHHVLAPNDEPTVRALESDDANVAGRVGLAVAVRELLDDGRITSRTVDRGRHDVAGSPRRPLGMGRTARERYGDHGFGAAGGPGRHPVRRRLLECTGSSRPHRCPPARRWT